jgi:hypothetical protein
LLSVVDDGDVAVVAVDVVAVDTEEGPNYSTVTGLVKKVFRCHYH